MHFIRDFWTRTSAVLSSTKSISSSIATQDYSLSSALYQSSLQPSTVATTPASITMPTLSSTITSTLTVFVTLTASSYGLPGGVAEGLRGLSECSQDVVFPLLADSSCNAGDYNCICSEFENSGAKDKVKSACNSDESDSEFFFAKSDCTI